jgi:hypothetical protein
MLHGINTLWVISGPETYASLHFNGDKNKKEDVPMVLVRLFAFCIVLVFVASFQDCALADENESSFRCGTGVIQLGDSNYRVLTECGPPAEKENLGFGDLEIWLYNRGTTDFMYRLKFQEGSVVEIIRGDRGF